MGAGIARVRRTLPAMYDQYAPGASDPRVHLGDAWLWRRVVQPRVHLGTQEHTGRPR